MIVKALALLLLFTPPTLAPVSIPTPPTPQPVVSRVYRSDSDRELLAWTVQQEVGGLHNPQATAAVVDVIYNRLDDPRFPDTLSEVLTPDQFNGVSNYVTRTNAPDEITYGAIDHATRGASNGALYFCDYDDLNADCSAWFDSLTLTMEVDGIRFYK